jgi:hypothetical protein
MRVRDVCLRLWALPFITKCYLVSAVFSAFAGLIGFVVSGSWWAASMSLWATFTTVYISEDILIDWSLSDCMTFDCSDEDEGSR